MTSAKREATGGIAWLRQHLFEVVSVEVLERDVNKPLPEIVEVPGMTLHRVTSSEPGRWRELVPRTQWRAVERFLARGDRGYLAVVEGHYAGRIWVSRITHRDHWSGLWIRLAPDEAYSYAMQATPTYRRLGVGAALVASMLSDLHEDRGVTRCYGWVDTRNRESAVLLRVVFGFTPVQKVRRAHLLRRIGWLVPGSDEPKFGPLSQSGRHSQMGGAPGD